MSQPDPRPGRPRWLGLALRLVFTAALVVWLASRIDLQATGQSLARAPWWAFATPVVLLLCNAGVHALRLRLLLGAAGAPLGYLATLSALLQAWFVGLALPRGGADLAKIGFLARRCGSVEAAAASLGAARVLELLPWLCVLLYGLAWGLLGVHPALGLVTALACVPFGGVLLLAAWGLWRGARVVAWARGVWPGDPEGWFARVGARLIRLAEHAVVMRERPWALVQAGVLGFVFAGVNTAVVWVVSLAYGVQVPVWDLLALVPAADLLISLPLTVGGFGVREALFVVVLGPYGATEALGVSIGLTRWVGELGRAAVGGLLFAGTGGGPRYGKMPPARKEPR